MATLLIRRCLPLAPHGFFTTTQRCHLATPAMPLAHAFRTTHAYHDEKSRTRLASEASITSQRSRDIAAELCKTRRLPGDHHRGLFLARPNAPERAAWSKMWRARICVIPCCRATVFTNLIASPISTRSRRRYEAGEFHGAERCFCLLRCWPWTRKRPTCQDATIRSVLLSSTRNHVAARRGAEGIVHNGTGL